MLNRWSVNVLLKSVICVMAAAAILSLGASAWTSYKGYTTASQVAVLAKGDAAVFEALHDLSIDQSNFIVVV